MTWILRINLRAFLLPVFPQGFVKRAHGHALIETRVGYVPEHVHSNWLRYWLWENTDREESRVVVVFHCRPNLLHDSARNLGAWSKGHHSAPLSDNDVEKWLGKEMLDFTLNFSKSFTPVSSGPTRTLIQSTNLMSPCITISPTCNECCSVSFVHVIFRNIVTSGLLEASLPLQHAFQFIVVT